MKNRWSLQLFSERREENKWRAPQVAGIKCRAAALVAISRRHQWLCARCSHLQRQHWNLLPKGGLTQAPISGKEDNNISPALLLSLVLLSFLHWFSDLHCISLLPNFGLTRIISKINSQIKTCPVYHNFNPAHPPHILLKEKEKQKPYCCWFDITRFISCHGT